jgi:hypothetical protein
MLQLGWAGPAPGSPRPAPPGCGPRKGPPEAGAGAGAPLCPVVAGQGLEQGVVLAVQSVADCTRPTRRRPGGTGARPGPGLLVGRAIVACPPAPRPGRGQPGRAHLGGQHQVGLAQVGELHVTLPAPPGSPGVACGEQAAQVRGRGPRPAPPGVRTGTPRPVRPGAALCAPGQGQHREALRLVGHHLDGPLPRMTRWSRSSTRRRGKSAAAGRRKCRRSRAGWSLSRNGR